MLCLSLAYSVLMQRKQRMQIGKVKRRVSQQKQLKVDESKVQCWCGRMKESFGHES